MNFPISHNEIKFRKKMKIQYGDHIDQLNVCSMEKMAGLQFFAVVWVNT